VNDQQRLLLASVLMAIVLIAAWTLGSRRSPRQPAPVPTALSGTADSTAPVIPDTLAAEAPAGPDSLAPAAPDSAAASAEAEVRTVTVAIGDRGGATIAVGSLSTAGGSLRSWILPGYRSLSEADGLVDLVARPAFETDGADGTPLILHTDSPETLLVAAGADSVVFAGPDGFRKVYRFEPGSFSFGLGTTGGSAGGISLEPGALSFTETAPSAGVYFSAAWYAEKYRTARSSSLEDERPLGRVKWAGARSQYFCLLLLPEDPEGRFDAFAQAPSREVSPGIRVLDDRVTVYAGPVDYEELRALGRGTDKLVDFGWPVIRWIGRLIYLFLSVVLVGIPNWGVRIIILSAAMKALLWPLSFSSARSMRRMQKVQPQLQELQKKHANDPMRLRQEMQKLYKEHGVNPLGGCLPLLLQMPVFFALYRVLQNGVDLRAAGFMLWMTDLSRPEVLIPFGAPILGMNGIGLLAVLMGISMFWQQKLTMTDPSQKSMLYMMPVLMTWLFMKFPAGLTLYWFVNNILSIIEQVILRRGRPAAAPPAASSPR